MAILVFFVGPMNLRWDGNLPPRCRDMDRSSEVGMMPSLTSSVPLYLQGIGTPQPWFFHAMSIGTIESIKPLNYKFVYYRAPNSLESIVMCESYSLVMILQEMPQYVIKYPEQFLHYTREAL